MLKLISFLLTISIFIILSISIDTVMDNKKIKLNINSKPLNKKYVNYIDLKYINNIKETHNVLKKKIKLKPTVKIKHKIKSIKKSVIKKEIIIKKEKQEINLKKFFTINKTKKVIKKQKSLYEKNKEIQKELESIKKLDKRTQSYIELYGDEYFKLSKMDKQFLKTNLNVIGQITQKYLKYPNISIRTKQKGVNVVEFILHKNGDISDLFISDSSQYTALDSNTIKTIKLAYKDYPRPYKQVKIKIYVQYIMY